MTDTLTSNLSQPPTALLPLPGITYDPKRNQLYTAMSSIRYGMENNQAKGKANNK